MKTFLPLFTTVEQWRATWAVARNGWHVWPVYFALLLSGCSPDARQSIRKPLEAATPTTTGSGTWTLSSGTNGNVIFSIAGSGTGALTFSGTTQPPSTPPPTPTGLTATATGPTSIAVSWNASSGATGYWLNRGSSLLYSDGTATQFTDSGLTPSTAYGYSVAAGNSAGMSAFSISVSATTPSQPPPSGLTRVVVPVQQNQLDAMVPLLDTLPASYSGSGGDLIYYADSSGSPGARLPCEVVASSASPTAEVWLGPVLFSGSLGTNTPTAYWRSTGSTTQTQQPVGMAAQVWDKYYACVLHMPVHSSNGTTTLPDSTSNANNANALAYTGSAVGPLGMAMTQQPTASGPGYGTSAYPTSVPSSSTMTLGTSGSPFTLEVLGYLDSYPGGQTSGGAAGQWWTFLSQLYWQPGSQDLNNWSFVAYSIAQGARCNQCLQVGTNLAWSTTSPMATAGTTNITIGQWHYYVVTFPGTAGGVPTYYLDGQLDPSQPCGPITGYTGIPQSPIATDIGAADTHDVGYALSGYIGETRISNGIARSQAYVAATWNQIAARGNLTMPVSLQKKSAMRADAAARAVKYTKWWNEWHKGAKR
jgi:hypothetical protein